MIMLRLLGLLILLPLIGYLINPKWVMWARLTLPDWLRWLGVICAAAMVPLFYWILKSIGLNISPSHTTREKHQLVTHGLYRWVRHPLYSAGLMFFLSLSLLTALWWLGIGFMVVFAFLMVRVPSKRQT